MINNKMSVVLFSLAALVSSVPAGAQSNDRDLTPVFPATGTWWSANNGEGRWGVVVEAQSGAASPEGQMAVTVFSYESGNIQRQAWYTSTGGFEYNANWRTDGMIGEMELQLQRSAGGTCLLCADGENAGTATEADVQEEARIVFLDGENAVLTVGNVGHPIVKAQWGDGVGGSSEDFWKRPFQLQLEAQTVPEVSDGGFALRFIDFVSPILVDEDVVFNGTPGWDVYEFEARGELSAGSIAGPEVSALDASFQIFANDLANDARLVMNADGFIAEMKLFSFSRYLLEGRTVNSFVPDPALELDLNANVLMISVPSMGVVGSPGNGPYPFRAFGEE